MTIGALAADAALTGAIKIDASREQGCRVSQARWHSEWLGKTAGQGPIMWGLAWDLDATQVAECMRADPQLDIEDDMEEILRNLVVLGIIPRASTVSPLAVTDHAPSYRTKKLPSWDIPEGSKLVTWHYIPVTGTTLTSGTVHHLTLGIKQGWLSD